MVQANNSNKQTSTASGNVLFDNKATLRLRIGEQIEVLALPLRYTGGDLGLTDSAEPWINFQDSSGRKYLTHSVQFVLQHIDAFQEGRDQVSLLAAAALHYGLGAHALMGADLDNITPDWRHEGPLALLHHNLGVTDFTGVAVKSHVGRCGMMLEEVLWRFDQFSEADQAQLLAGLAKHFDLGQVHRETAGAA